MNLQVSDWPGPGQAIKPIKILKWSAIIKENPKLVRGSRGFYFIYTYYLSIGVYRPEVGDFQSV